MAGVKPAMTFFDASVKARYAALAEGSANTA